MERFNCRRLVQLTVWITLTCLCTADEVAHVITNGKGNFINIIEKGIMFVGQYHLTFRLKACGDSVIVFSNVVAITNTYGRYFLLLIGSNKNKFLIVQDSCFECERNAKKELALLKCDQFVPFWVLWDEKGQLLFGHGNTPGNNSLIGIKGSRRHYPMMNIAVTSTGGTTAHWVFDSVKLPTTFLRPLPRGLSVIELNEALPVGSDVMKLLLRSPPRNTTFTLGGESASLFTIQDDTIKLAHVLNYCQKRFHLIQIGSSIPGLATSVTVEVGHGQCGRSSEHGVSSLLLPEELPVGSVINWARPASDTRNNYSYTLNGPLVDYLDIRPHGELVVQKQLDVDKDVSVPSLVNMTVSRGDILYNISVTISDVNDNPPVFERELYILSTGDNMTTDTQLADMEVHDADVGDQGVFNLSIGHSVSGVFYVRSTRLYIRPGQSDPARAHRGVYSFIVRATDTSSSLVTQTGTTAVLVKILPMANPVWVSHVPDNMGRFPDVEVSDSVPVGSLLTTYRVRNIGSTNTTFVLHNITDKEYAGVLMLEPKSGELRTAAPLNRHGMERSVYFTVSASREATVLTGYQRLIVIHSDHTEARVGHSDQPQAHFDQEVYEIQVDHLHTGTDKTLLTFHVIGLIETQDIHIVLDKDGETIFNIKNRQNSFQLLLKNHIAQNSGFPTIVLMNLMNPSNTLGISTAYILIRKFLTICPVRHMWTVTPSRRPFPTDAPRVSGRRHRNHDGGCAPVDQTLENVLITISVYEGAGLLALLAAYRKRKRMKQCKRRKRNTLTKPVRQEPIGCESDNSVEETAIDVPNNKQTTALKTRRCSSVNGSAVIKNVKAQTENESTNTGSYLGNTRKSTKKLDFSYRGHGSMSACDTVYTLAPNSVADDGRDGSMSVCDTVYTLAPNSVADDGRDGSMSVCDTVYTLAPNSVADDGRDGNMSVCDTVYTLAPNSVADDGRGGSMSECGTLAPNSVADDGRDGSMSECATLAPNSVADDGRDGSMSVCDTVYTLAPNSVAENILHDGSPSDETNFLKKV